MDAVKFLTEKERMCRNIPDCRDCELTKNKCCSSFNTEAKAEKAVAIVEQWSKEHPIKTRASEFLKVYPNACMNSIDGYPSVIPCELDFTFHKGPGCDKGCPECRRKYWSEEIK